jgi:hypothetical protein
VIENLAIGPGASLGAEAECFYSKVFCGDLSGTSQYLYHLYQVASSRSVLWRDAEKVRATRYGMREVRGNRLFFVLKNNEISRTCCTEALLNMLVQQALGAFLLMCNWDSYGIDLTVQQDINRNLTMQASVDGSFSTTDLTSASDSMLWSFIRANSPSAFAGMVNASRSPCSVLPDGSEVKLEMVSTMGNGFTFPLQTLLFASAVKATYQLKGIPLSGKNERPNFAVFGDDIIVRTECTSSLHRVLALIGFEVNADKSFASGPFRESCGVDAFQGVDIRGVYIKSLRTPHDLYSAFNRLARWSARFGYLENTLQFLWSKARHLRVPYSESDSAGFKMPMSCLPQPPKRDQFGFQIYKGLAFKPARIPVPESSEEAKQLTPTWPFNGSGWVVSFLGGFSGTSPDCWRWPNYEEMIEHDITWTFGESPRHFAGRRPYPGEERWYQRRSFIPYWDYADCPTKDFHGWKTVMALFTSK